MNNDDDNDEVRYWFLVQFFVPGEFGNRVRYTLLLFLLGMALGLIGWLYVPAGTPGYYIFQAVAGIVVGLTLPRLIWVDPF
ncbi:MAG: hypothetical protein ACYCVY_11710 [Acidiferrobacteraceae bacterium]